VDKSDLLRPVDVAARIHDVLFTVGQVCTIARITKMQLDLWTERASIATLGALEGAETDGPDRGSIAGGNARSVRADVRRAVSRRPPATA